MFRFTIRDLLWLTLVTGLVLGWWCWWHSLPVPAEGFIRGQALVSGKPIVSGRAFLYSGDGQFRGTQIENGLFNLESVPYGKYRLSFEGGNAIRNEFDVELDNNCQAIGGTFNKGPTRPPQVMISD
jgi:hypothetical protein